MPPKSRDSRNRAMSSPLFEDTNPQRPSVVALHIIDTGSLKFLADKKGIISRFLLWFLYLGCSGKIRGGI